MIASGYLPALFSENLCNGKLVMALQKDGIEVDVISKIDEGPTYGSDWTEPWSELRPHTHLVTYPVGSRLSRVADVLYSGLRMDGCFQPGVRWIRRAYDLAVKMMSEKSYDAVLTRSPGDMAHLVGYKLKKKTGVKWIANWNDPANPIWPGEYKHDYTDKEQARHMAFTERLLLGADIVTFPSDSLRRHFVAHFPKLSGCRTEVIPHIALLPSIWPAQKGGFDGKKLMMLHSGNLSPERNPEKMFRALRRLIDETGFRDFEFHVMGHVNDYTERLISDYCLADNVRSIGSFPYLEALARMQAYDLLVLLEAKLDQGIFFASKFTDYLQSGKPVWAISPVSGFAKDILFGHKGEYLSDNTDVESIYTQLKLIVDNWKQGSLQQTDSSLIFENFSAHAVVSKYKSIVGINQSV